jgi:hypothetical protein
MSESYNEKYAQYLKEKNSLHYRLRAKGGYLYCCSSQYPNDYYDMCNSLWYKYFIEYNPKITEAKETYNRYMNMTYLDFREARESGRKRLRQPQLENPKGIIIDLNGYTAIMKDWEDIATAGGQYDNND